MVRQAKKKGMFFKIFCLSNDFVIFSTLNVQNLLSSLRFRIDIFQIDWKIENRVLGETDISISMTYHLHLHLIAIANFFLLLSIVWQPSIYLIAYKVQNKEWPKMNEEITNL